MTWIKFTLWLCGIYGAYYAGIITMDHFKKRRSPVATASHDLTFVEHIQPEQIQAAEKPVSAIVATGGKTIKEIFGLAREEVIEYTRAVSF